jgi:hypothetical protein
MVAQRAVYLCLLRKIILGTKENCDFLLMKFGFIHTMQFTDAGQMKILVSEVYTNCNANQQCQKRNGVHTHALLVYNAKSKSSDYHNEMDTINFTKCVKK